MKTWRRNIKPARKYPTIFEGRNTHVARVVANSGEDDATIEARCNLIAAAPELLEALNAYLTATSAFAIERPTATVAELTSCLAARGWPAKAFAAIIAKAEGRE